MCYSCDQIKDAAESKEDPLYGFKLRSCYCSWHRVPNSWVAPCKCCIVFWSHVDRVDHAKRGAVLYDQLEREGYFDLDARNAYRSEGPQMGADCKRAKGDYDADGSFVSLYCEDTPEWMTEQFSQPAESQFQ